MHVISTIYHMVLQSLRQLCPPHLHFSNNPSLLGLLRTLHTSEQLHTAAMKKPATKKNPFIFPNVILLLQITLTWSSIFSLEQSVIFCLGSVTDSWLLLVNPWGQRWELGSPKSHKLYLFKIHPAAKIHPYTQILTARKLSGLKISNTVCYKKNFSNI